MTKRTPICIGISTEEKSVENTHEIMTIPEAAAFLRIGENTLRGLIKYGKVPAFKVGGQWRLLRSDVLDHLTGGGA